MIRLYSDSFFHYTEELKNLQGIVKLGFRVSLAEEQFIRPSNDLYYVKIPMVSFCDIPLSLIDYVTYGNLGIGMSRSWGNRNLLQPVNYFSTNKQNNSNKVVRQLTESYKSGEHSLHLLRQLSAYKPVIKYKDKNRDYGARFIVTKKGKQKKVFYRRDNYIEREWRKPYLKYWDEKYYELNPTYLKFHPKDVSFLIVNSVEEKDSLIQSILSFNMIGGNNCTEAERLTLATRILVMKEIKKNF